MWQWYIQLPGRQWILNGETHHLPVGPLRVMMTVFAFGLSISASLTIARFRCGLNTQVIVTRDSVRSVSVVRNGNHRDTEGRHSSQR
jgi:hypothetical protein